MSEGVKVSPLHKDALVWDNHVCLPMDPDANLAAMPELYRYRKVGTDVVSLNIGYANYSHSNHMKLARQMREWLAARPDDFMLAHSAQDIRTAKSRGVLSVVFDIEGAKVLNGDVTSLEEFAALGVRWMAVAYNQNNMFAGGCHDDDSGLSELGQRMIDEMFRVGITPCCSHTGYGSALSVIDYASGPVLFSHSNPRGVHPHPRNIPDVLIDRCAGKGGVIGVNGVNAFLGDGYEPTVESLARHIDYLVQRVGSAAVSIALDSTIGYDFKAASIANPSVFPDGHGYDRLKIMEPEQTPRITDALKELGYSDADIRNILGFKPDAHRRSQLEYRFAGRKLAGNQVADGGCPPH